MAQLKCWRDKGGDAPPPSLAPPPPPTLGRASLAPPGDSQGEHPDLSRSHSSAWGKQTIQSLFEIISLQISAASFMPACPEELAMAPMPRVVCQAYAPPRLLASRQSASGARLTANAKVSEGWGIICCAERLAGEMSAM